MIVKEILDAMVEKVATLLPDYKKSPYSYELDKNNRKASKKIYAVRVAGGSSVSGVLGSATLAQDYEVILSDVFTPKGDSDKDIEVKLLNIHNDIEKIYRDVYQKRLDLPSTKVLLVEVVELSTPEVDLENNTVSITATFRVRYRSQF